MNELTSELETVSVENEHVTNLLKLLHENLEESTSPCDDIKALGACFLGRASTFLSLVSVALEVLMAQNRKIDIVLKEMYKIER